MAATSHPHARTLGMCGTSSRSSAAKADAPRNAGGMVVPRMMMIALYLYRSLSIRI